MVATIESSVSMDKKCDMPPEPPPPPPKPIVERETWANKAEFILSCMGYAIGLGNVWRFPYLCYRNGGGAFLVPYLLMLCFCGIPLFYVELNLGQFTSLGCVSVWRLAPLLKGAGYAMVVINVICTVYYNLIITYPLMFMLQSFGRTLPWESCTNEWNTEKCLMVGRIFLGCRLENNNGFELSVVRFRIRQSIDRRHKFLQNAS